MVHDDVLPVLLLPNTDAGHGGGSHLDPDPASDEQRVAVEDGDAVESAGLIGAGGGEERLEVGHRRAGGAEDLHGAAGAGGIGDALQEDLGDVVAVDAGPAGDEVALTQVERRSPGPW